MKEDTKDVFIDVYSESKDVINVSIEENEGIYTFNILKEE